MSSAVSFDRDKSHSVNRKTHEFSATPPDGLPSYRLLTGSNDAAFCYRVSEALSLGYKLYGSPAITHDGTQVYVAQAVLWAGSSQITD